MKKRLIILGGGIIAAAVAAVLTAYILLLPALVSNRYVCNQIESFVSKTFGAELEIRSPVLYTGLKPIMGFSVESIKLNKGKNKIIDLKNLETEFSFNGILTKRITVNKILAENIYVNVSDFIELFPQDKNSSQKENKKNDFNIDLFSSVLGVRRCSVIYGTPDLKVNFDAKNVLLDRTRDKKPLHFDFDFEIQKDKDKILISANDDNKIYMGNGELHIDKFPIKINKSEIVIDALLSAKTGYEINVSSKNFSVRDIYDIAYSDILIQGCKELLMPIKDVQGSADFNLNLAKDNINGNINIHDSEFKIKDLLNMPVKITGGIIDIGNTEITLKDFKGYYNNKKENSIKFEGNIKDYWNTFDTKIVSNIFVNDDFFKNYVSVLLGSPIDLIGDAGSRLTLLSKNGSCSIEWYFLLNEGEGFKLGDQSMVLENYKTLFKVDMSVVKNILKINTIDYYITSELTKGMTPILSLNGSLDTADNMKLLDMKLKITRPLPSEFLNFLACQKLFRKGKISGEMGIINTGEYPKMEGMIVFDGVAVPSQKLFIKSAKIIARGEKLGAIAEGKFKRSNYDFKGYVLNDLRLPIVVKDVNLTVDNVDLEKMLEVNNSAAAASVNTAAEQIQETADTEDESENVDIPTFTKDLVIVEKCALNLKSGKYKEVDFGNLEADLTLDKDGVLNLQSNKFDIAEGISTLKVRADLIKKEYYLRLGIKDVNSNTMASALLGLPREISGKAKGLIEIHSDETLKLNGDIKFNIQNGTIEKVGYVEYILKAASLLRNPLAMISPAVLGDLVNIPEGKFDMIKGELKLKDNVAERIDIKSSAPKLSSFITGKYDLTSGNSSLRIYTKMSNKGKGFAGFLRGISLNSIANRISASGRNDSNYYAAELEQIPDIDTDIKDSQVFLTTVDGDVANFNFISSLKRIK